MAVLALALAAATTAVAAAATPPTATHAQTDQRRALYQSELERNLQLRTQRGQEGLAQRGLAAQRKALYHSELERTLARHRPHGTVGGIAVQPAPRTDPAVPSRDVAVVTTLLVGLIGGGAAMAGWTAASRWRLHRAASAT